METCLAKRAADLPGCLKRCEASAGDKMKRGGAPQLENKGGQCWGLEKTEVSVGA